MPGTGEVTQVTTPAPREIRVERVVRAPRDKVWKAYTDPVLLAQWWGRGNRLEVEKLEVVRGGRWRVVEHSSHGVHGFEGRYREVTPTSGFVRSFEWDGMPGHVAIEFVTLESLDGGRTRIVTLMQMHTPEERDGFLQSGMKPGMEAAYAALDAVLA